MSVIVTGCDDIDDALRLAEGKYVHYCDCVTKPSETWLKPLADLSPEEAQHLKDCDEREAIAYAAEMKRYASMSEDALSSQNGAA